MIRPNDRLAGLRRIARTVPGGMAFGRWLNRHFNPDLRAIAAVRRNHADCVLQPYPDTAEDRYPALFDALADRLAGIAAPRILSFGCSSGEEVRALRRRMPGARIVGLDLNRRALEKARSADTSPLSHYRLASAPDPHEAFDAILALAVFRHGDLEASRPESCAGLLLFARFEDAMAALDRCLATGGWLAIWHAHFRLLDTLCAANYAPDEFRMENAGVQDLLYGSDNRLIDGAIEETVLFRKRAARSKS